MIIWIMLGFAVVDISAADRAVAVWLISAVGSSAAHSNAVAFGFDDIDADNGPLLALIADRYVVLSARTNADHLILTGARITPCAVDDLAAATAKSHSELEAAIVEYASLARRRGVTPLARSTTHVVLDQAGLRTATARAALAVANHLRVTWTAWLALNADWQRRPYLAEHPDRPRSAEHLAPPAFVATSSPQPLSVLR